MIIHYLWQRTIIGWDKYDTFTLVFHKFKRLKKKCIWTDSSEVSIKNRKENCTKYNVLYRTMHI